MDSVMSDRPSTRPMTNTLILPRINNGARAGECDPTRASAMPTIEEEGIPKDSNAAVRSPVNETNNNAEEIMPIERIDEDLQKIADEMEKDGLTLPDFNVTEGAEQCQNFELPNDLDLFDPDAKNDTPLRPSPPLHVPPSRQGSRMSFQLPKAAAVSFADDLLPATPKSQSACNSRRSLSPIRISHSATPRLEGTPKPPSFADFTRSKTFDKIHLDKPPSPSGNNAFTPTPPPPKDSAKRVTDSSCGHRNAGQELCYLCHQRERRNIPVSFTEERKKREMEEDRLLQQYQQLKDVEAIFKEQPSYVFEKRPLTPPRFLKQEVYYKELADQVVSKTEKTKKRKADEEFLERLEQVQLAEDLAAQREQYLKDKMEQQDQYKRALSAQVRFKPLPIPARVPDSSEPVFGKNDMTNEGLAERRRRAHELYKEQVGTVEQKKREAILKRLHEHKEEESVLQKTKKDLREDRAERYERLFKARKHLEEDWHQALKAKRDRETDERLHSRSPGNLLLDQSNPYKRCGQCKRNMNNTGESNIWRESRYIPGSRLIV